MPRGKRRNTAPVEPECVKAEPVKAEPVKAELKPSAPDLPNEFTLLVWRSFTFGPNAQEHKADEVFAKVRCPRNVNPKMMAHWLQSGMLRVKEPTV